MVALVVLTAVHTRAALEQPRARFQWHEVAAARANFERLLAPGAVVITTEDVGRPAENIEYYTRAHALYLTDLRRWRVRPETAAAALLAAGFQPYLYFPTRHPHHDPLLKRLREADLSPELVAVVPPDAALVHFVAASFHRGVAMGLYRLVPVR
jgi:hypothetical protein